MFREKPAANVNLQFRSCLDCLPGLETTMIDHMIPRQEKDSICGSNGYAEDGQDTLCGSNRYAVDGLRSLISGLYGNGTRDPIDSIRNV